MSTKTLRELLEDAASKVDMYKNPDISEALAALDPVLEAGGMGRINRDTVLSIDFFRDHVSIVTEYTARGCTDQHTYNLATSVVDAADPIHASKVWCVQMKINAAESELNRYERLAKNAKDQLLELHDQLATLQTKAGV